MLIYRLYLQLGNKQYKKPNLAEKSDRLKSKDFLIIRTRFFAVFFCTFMAGHL